VIYLDRLGTISSYGGSEMGDYYNGEPVTGMGIQVLTLISGWQSSTGSTMKSKERGGLF
jgi:hypothetical protein